MLFIIGRTASGKDTVARILREEKGLKQVKSYTTRDRRYPKEDTHIFISRDEAEKKLREEQIVAKTKVNKNLYFATLSQLWDNDIYIIDPNGLYGLLDHFHSIPIDILYVMSGQEERGKRAEERGHNPIREKQIYEKRELDEDEQFSKFEKTITNPNNSFLFMLDHPEVKSCKIIHNDRSLNDLKQETLRVYDLLQENPFSAMNWTTK